MQSLEGIRNTVCSIKLTGAASLSVHRLNALARWCAEGTEEEIPHDEVADEELDEEAKAMLKELDDSQAEVQSLLAAHRVQADELGGMRDNLTNEVRRTWDMGKDAHDHVVC